MMRKALLLLSMMLLAVLPSQAQEAYRPLLKDGKVWKELLYSPTPEIEWTKYISGDTLIDGKTYYKMYRRGVSRYENELEGAVEKIYPDEFFIALREEGSKVYMYLWQSDQLLYDFGMAEGDSLLEATYYWLKMGRTDTVSVGDRLFRRHRVTECHDLKYGWDLHMNGLPFPEDQEPIERSEGYWIEGVGSHKGPTSLYIWQGLEGVYSRYSKLLSCYEDGECIFTAEDFVAPPVVSSMEKTRNDVDDKAASFYDLQGRRLSGQPAKKGIYIRGGRKIQM